LINKKSLVTFGALTVIAGASFVGTNLVSAQSSSNGSLASRIASVFNLDETKVQSVVQDFMDEEHIDRQQVMDEYLQSLVDNGTITEVQKTTLQESRDMTQAKVKELKDQGATREEVQSAVKESRDSVKAWAKEQGLSLENLHPDKDNERGEHRGMHHFDGPERNINHM